MKAKPTERDLFEAFTAHAPGYCKRAMAASKTIYLDKRGRTLAEFDKQNRLCLLERGILYEAVTDAFMARRWQWAVNVHTDEFDKPHRAVELYNASNDMTYEEHEQDELAFLAVFVRQVTRPAKVLN
jgi:hypothetical protein